MSCHLNKCAVVVNYKNVKTALNFDNEPEEDPYSATAWESAWDDDKVQDNNSAKFDDHLWLEKCLISLSPVLDVLAFAHEQYAVFLTSKYDVNEEGDTKLKFSTSFEGKLALEKDETITSIMCLPLASQKRSLHGGPDWTCVVVGFSSGFVRIYTEKAEVLLAQLLHEEPVSHLKCKTFAHQHFPNVADQPEEVIIAYCSVVVTIDGFGLFQTLRACRNQLARAAAGKHELSQPPPLSYKKFGVLRFVDCDAAGTVGVPAFDHLVTESIRRGFYGNVKPNVPSCSHLITAGTNPYVGFYHASEVAGQLLLTDVVHAVASKLMSFITHSNAGGLLGGLMGRGDSVQQKERLKIEPPSNLPMRFGLYDKRRQGISVVLSPNKSLVVVSDGFGRVILFDALKGVAVRMWKGYRDAQCGWVEVEDDMHQKDIFQLPTEKKKRAFFLIIYAPRRGILEVWCSQQGPRVAAFNVGKSGRLIYPGYGMVGATFASNISVTHLPSCYFLDVDGLLKKLVIPFHLTLSERNSKHVRDLHLLKELRLSIRSSFKGKAVEMIKILKDMRTANIRLQALDSLFSSHHCTSELVSTVVSGLLTHLGKQDPSESDYKMKLLKQACVRAQQLVKLYTALNAINSKTVCSSSDSSDLDVQLYASTLCISETEAGRMMSYITLHQTVVSSLKKQVRFMDDNVTDLSFSDFLSFFNITDSPLQKTGEQIVMKNLIVELKSNITEKQLESLGGYLFHTSLYAGGCHSSLQSALKECGLLPEKLLHLLLCHWVANSEFCEDPQKWLNLQQTMKQISSLSDPKLVSVDTEDISPWWKAVRDMLEQSTSNTASYICAIIARSVSIVMASAFHVEMRNAAGESKKLKDGGGENSDSGGDSDWEAVSLDLEHWNLLVKQLEDVLLLSILLKSQPYGKVIVRDVNISLSGLLTGGQGTVTDLVAVWAVCVGLQPSLLSSFFMSENDEELSIPEKCISDNKSDMQTLYMIKGIINELRKKFPYSLNHDVLLANCSWEHLMQWNRNKEVVDHLKQSLSCFELIRNSIIKHGFASIMWKSCIQSKFEALALLIEKVGKTPKERLCQKELEMNDNRLEDFIHYSSELLNIILESSVLAELEEVPKYKCEELWQDRESHGPTPLILMALRQKVSNNATVYLHVMLSIACHLIITFQMKNSRPLGLFGPLMKKALFRELHYNLKTTSENDDSSLQTTRLQFLMRAISGIAQSVTETIPEIPTSPPCVGGAADESSALCGVEAQRCASKWMNRVIDLGRDWGLNLDELRRHHVCDLYSSGQDLLAEQASSCVTDRTLLASQLLLISGQRIYKLIYDSPDPASRLGFLSPDLSAWIKTLDDKKLRCCNVPMQVTLNLTNNIVAYLLEGSREQLLALALRDALKGLAMVSGNSLLS